MTETSITSYAIMPIQAQALLSTACLGTSDYAEYRQQRICSLGDHALLQAHCCWPCSTLPSTCVQTKQACRKNSDWMFGGEGAYAPHPSSAVDMKLRLHEIVNVLDIGLVAHPARALLDSGALQVDSLDACHSGPL